MGEPDIRRERKEGSGEMHALCGECGSQMLFCHYSSFLSDYWECPQCGARYHIAGTCINGGD